MDELFPGVFKVYPTVQTPLKYISFFVQRRAGNLLFPCFSNSSTIHGSFDDIAAKGGIARQLLGDSHFRTAHCDEVAERFGAPLYCSEPEAPDVLRKVKQVVPFSFEPHALESGVEVIPTPGHRPGGVCYRVTLGKRQYLFAGDAIWHDGKGWQTFPSAKGRKQLVASLRTLADLDFDVLLANTTLNNPVCFVEFDAAGRRQFMDSIVDGISA